MSPEAQSVLASSFTALAAVHHLAFAVVMVMFWIRRRSMERAIALYFAAAFGTVTFAAASHSAARPWAVLAAVLCALWVREAVRPVNKMSFRRTPKARLFVMGALGILAFVYPGYSPGLPAFVFSPLGVTLPPTLLAALAVMNSAAPATDRPLHWTLAASGIIVSVYGLVLEGWIHIPLLIGAAYAAPLLTGWAKVIDERSEVHGTSVDAVRDRIHKRRVLFTRARRSNVRRLDFRKHRR